MSGSEVLIYGYGAVCLSMIVFNIVYNIVLRKKEPQTTIKAEHVKEALLKNYSLGGWQTVETEECRRPGAAEQTPEASAFLRTQGLEPGKSEHLLLLSEALTLLADEGQEEAAERFIEGLQPLLPALAEEYLKKDIMQTAYFAVFLQRYRRDSEYDSAILESLLKYASRENMYCRINALDAFYAIGNEEYVVKAVAIQDKMEAFLHEKVLTEGLLSFSGDHGKLIEKLIGRFSEFTVKTRLSILNYIRLKSDGWKEFMFRIMTDENEDRELRLAAVRYFGRYPWERARGVLIGFAVDKEVLRWEYAAVAAGALKDYSGEDIISALKSALSSSNWYVRYNAAVSLEAKGLSYAHLMDVMLGNDRYAREMMEYRLEERRLMEERELQKEGNDR